MILATDVYYRNDNTATAAGILFPTWNAAQPVRTILEELRGIASYEPGSFYKRELPCLLQLYQAVTEPLAAIVIDGYVTLGSAQTPGLGMHLYESIGRATPIIGVAKKFFTGTPEACKLWRGQSENPLYVTAIGVALSEAKAAIQQMHGGYRMPTLLKIVDQLGRGIEDKTT
jgi:deoxyribonuclease V